MLKIVKKLEFDLPHQYAPEVVDHIINMKQIKEISPIKTRRIEPCVVIKFVDDGEIVCLGEVKDFKA